MTKTGSKPSDEELDAAAEGSEPSDAALSEAEPSDAEPSDAEPDDAEPSDADPSDAEADSGASDADASADEPVPKKGRWKRRLLGTAVVGAVGMVALWIAVHRIPWLGPMLANGLRSVVGVEAVTKLEDFVYGAQDRWNRLWRSDEAPKAYWEVPAGSATPTPAASIVTKSCSVPPFRPADVGAVHKSWSAPGDGMWIPIDDQRHPDEAPRLYKTLVHPDKNRSWAAISVVAVDRRTVKLHPMAGRYEPKSLTKEAKDYKRVARIPDAHHAALLAAFNGGFKTEHGKYGMRIDGVTLIPPRARSCWVAAFVADELVIGDWERLKEREPKALWWRQTPACMVEEGKLHPGLVSEKNTLWGATLDRNTVIRRSAIGLSADGKVLYSGIGDNTTAKALAEGMKHIGAEYVAQLDVNWSYPKFVIYQPKAAGSDELIATKLADGFEFREDEFIGERVQRDFFYLTRKSTAEVEDAVCGAGAEPPAASAAPEESAAPAGSAAPGSTAPAGSGG